MHIEYSSILITIITTPIHGRGLWNKLQSTLKIMNLYNIFTL